MLKAIVVLNPVSGGGAAKRVWGLIKASCDTTGVEAIETLCPGQATSIARDAAKEGVSRVVAIGGDGTVNEVMNGLVGSQTALAVVPAGTGNDWVRTVGVPKIAYDAWHVALNGSIVTSDVGIAVGHRHFLNVAGVGFDAEVARNIASMRGISKVLPPTERYIACAIKTLATYSGAVVRVEIDGERSTIDGLFLMAVAVAKYYGSGMLVAPEAEINDGLFDIVWGSRIKKVEVVGLLGRIFRGTHVLHKKVTTQRCTKITLDSDAPLWFHLDGDVVGKLPVTFRIVPDALKIVVP